MDDEPVGNPRACHGRIKTILLVFTAVICFSVNASDDQTIPNLAIPNCAVRIRHQRHEGAVTFTGHGTAFGVDLSSYGLTKPRYLLSASHNVQDDGNVYGDIRIEISENEWISIAVVSFDPNLDICLLKSSVDLQSVAKLAEKDVAVGGNLTLVGSPRGAPIAIFDGILLRKFDRGTVRSLAKITFDHGDSGGPFFDAKTGLVVGMAVAGVPKDGDMDHEVGLYVPLVAITSFLESIGKPSR